MDGQQNAASGCFSFRTRAGLGDIGSSLLEEEEGSQIFMGFFTGRLKMP